MKPTAAGAIVAALFAMMATVASPVSAATVKAVEYFHPQFDHYFVTASPAEIAALDGGAVKGWLRTGQRYRVDDAPAADLAPVCRFHTAVFADKPTHFFTASAAECDLLKSWPDWLYEGIAFYARLPDGQGSCGAGTAAIHRLYNGGQGSAPNHAYTAEPAKRDTLVAAGWISEGVAYCVPLAVGDPAAMTQLLAGSRWQFTDTYTWLLETRFDPAPAVTGYVELATEMIASWGFPKPPEAIYHQPNDRRPFGPGDGFWDGVAAWDPLSGEYVVLSLDNFDGIWVAWTFDNAQVTSTPVCATVLRQNFGRVGPGLHSFQPTLASGCEPGVAYRLTP